MSSLPEGERAVHGLVDHLFRHQAARLVSILVRHLGGRHLDLAEEVVQEPASCRCSTSRIDRVGISSSSPSGSLTSIAPAAATS